MGRIKFAYGVTEASKGRAYQNLVSNQSKNVE